MDGPLGDAISLPAERRETKAALLLAKGDLKAAAELYEQALVEQPDDWINLLSWLDCTLPTTSSNTQPPCSYWAVAKALSADDTLVHKLAHMTSGSTACNAHSHHTAESKAVGRV